MKRWLKREGENSCRKRIKKMEEKASPKSMGMEAW